MSTPRLTKLRKQPNSTWAQLQKRLIALPDPFETLFPAEVWSFILNKSHSISTNPGYVSSTLITTTAFMAGTATTLKTATQEMPLNIYSIFVGPPTTGKSQAIKECAISPMASVTAEADSASPVIQKCTSSGLIKTVADNNRGFLLSAEIYDVLFKLLKSDEENATGDVQALCQLFSGEEASYRYATEKTREIAANTPFCILGATQIPFAAHLVALLDQGHGLLDRFLITFPKCSRPTPTQTSQAIEALKESGLSSVEDIFVEIARLHLSRSTYTLDQEATETVNTINEQFIAEVNEAILEGTSPPKTKKIDIILRVAAALHIFNHVTEELLQGRQPTQPADEIEKSTLLCAIEYVNWAESQKEIFVEVSDMKSFYLKIPRLLSKLYTSDNPFYLVQGVEEGKGVS